jgi:cytochrome c peroxidase
MARIIPVLIGVSLFIIIVPVVGFSADFNAETKQFMRELETQAKTRDSSFEGFDPERGRKIFFDEFPDEKLGKVSCATCHNSDLKESGKTPVGKTIDPLAPSVNKNSLTSVKKIKKWLLRNFKQVYGREGDAKEKGDVLMFINTQ